ncbi:redox-regulated ATPase YchF [Patescibacteria group bacterium]|nr:redox-regulated ATPase YchF [Patescibacteria group bacterium]MBU1922528.1 redox-regulated ATPase YchF [Patescibacteria group bacterium]
MSLKIGIIGLPNVGKSTLFQALTSNEVDVANYPFCTIDPNVGMVEVPDERLKKLAQLSKSAKTTPTVIEFVDIAGLVKDAHRGEGLGNQFLAHIREADALAMVIRFFEDGNVVHVAGGINPAEDIQTINLELILADLALAEKCLNAASRETKSGDKAAIAKLNVLEKIKQGLDRGEPVRHIFPNPEDLEIINEIQFLTSKKMLYIANVGEDMAAVKPEELIKKYGLPAVIQDPDTLIPISAKIESEIANLPSAERREYLASLNLERSGLDRLTRAAYGTLGLISFFTTGEKETRAWTIQRGWAAPRAAGRVHSDMEKGFISADVCAYDNFIELGGEEAARRAGKMQKQGREYEMRDGDICIFYFSN